MEINQSDRRDKKVKYSAITLGIVLATAFVLVQPTMQNTYGQVGAEGAPNYFDCRFNTADQLADPFEMNTVRVSSIAKTIIAEKELLYCTFNTGPSFAPNVAVYADDDKKIEQYTIEEIWENLNLAPGDTVVKQAVESLRCTTLVTEAFVESCQFASVPVQEYDDED